MPARGRIYRVSGPLVIAENMRGSMVYEVVEVGNERLIGEIIGVEGDKAIIQVYEDTTGLRVGDKVLGTGHPLAAELGPGLISSIYDGIQRPLPVLQELAGFFVKRGIKAAPLPRDKKWHFIPTARQGEKVGPGDYLGYVQESETIRHYIMVPPGVHGEIKEIVPEGDYAIEDTIASIDGKEVNMLQKWPVRKPRPYKEKLEPNEPLITGQRVIDFLFPLAKGGKAAIPGGFGTGKCVPPGTPVLFWDGTVKPIDEIFAEAKGTDPDPSLPEELIDVEDRGIYVVAFDGKRLRRAKVTHIYRGYTDRIVRIKTASGRIIEVTPPHKLPVLGRGGIEFKPAGTIRKGEYLAVPSKLPSPQPSIRYFDLSLLKEHSSLISRDEETDKAIRDILEALSEDELKIVARDTGIRLTRLERIIHGNEPIPLSLVDYLRTRYGDRVKYPSYVGTLDNIRIPTTLTPDLAEIMGIIASAGRLRETTIILDNISEDTCHMSLVLLEKLFGIPGDDSNYSIHHCTIRVPGIVADFLSKIAGCGACHGNMSRELLSFMMSSPDNVIASFLTGFYAARGRLGDEGIIIETGSTETTHMLSYLLSRLGLTYTVNHVDGELVLPIEAFELLASSDASPVAGRPGELDTSATGISNSGSAAQNQQGASTTLLLLNTTIKGEGRHARLHKDTYRSARQIVFDMIVGVEELPVRTMVYDLTVEDYHNFVGGYVPVIYHNTVTLQQLTKWSAVDIAIYVGCGERGNEMADALHSFRKLVDPRTGKPLVERSVFIANTSNMPVAARETSIFLGATLGEYFRDMGYHVLMVADSTSRWAEAMREISGRLEELPGEEGYPAYLGSRLASFYERSGFVKTIGSPERTGSLTIMGAVSPPGADFSEPVTQSTLRIVRALYALDVNLAYRRHYPAINWLISYSLYVDNVTGWWHKNITEEWRNMREKALAILQKEAELEELVRLVGAEALPEEDKLLLETARMIREDFLQQNAFHEVDTYCPPKKTAYMMKAILLFYELGLKALRSGATVEDIRKLKSRIAIARMKEIPNKDFEPKFEELFRNIREDYEKLIGGKEI